MLIQLDLVISKSAVVNYSDVFFKVIIFNFLIIPVFIQSYLKGLNVLGVDNMRWEAIPKLDRLDTKIILSDIICGTLNNFFLVMPL